MRRQEQDRNKLDEFKNNAGDKSHIFVVVIRINRNI